jgi:hypothetical protein
MRRRPTPRAVASGIGWTLATASYLFLVAHFGWTATPVLGLHLYGDDWAPGDVEAYSRITAALLALLVAGAALLPRRPRLGGTLVVAGLVVTPAVFWWAAPLLAPMAAAAGAGAITLARRARARQARASSATS